MKNFNHIPGMIEPIEQELLKAIAKSIEFDENDILIEYGAFFGRSTNCILEGVKNNKSYSSSNKLIIYDSFKCKSNGAFAKIVYQFAKGGKVETLISKDGDFLSFRRIFDHYISSNIDLQVNECELQDLKPISSQIAFMHIDCPKFFSEFKYILNNHFKNLKVGAIVIFQDFFYHWSATLIAVVELLIQQKILEINETAASSIKTTVLKKISVSDIQEINHIMTTLDINKTIEQAILRLANQQDIIDRIHNFLPRIMLANVQYYYETGFINEANRHINNYLNNYPVIMESVMQDLKELKSFNFSMRSLYELDHNLSGIFKNE